MVSITTLEFIISAVKVVLWEFESLALNSEIVFFMHASLIELELEEEVGVLFSFIVFFSLRTEGFDFGAIVFSWLWACLGLRVLRG